jgi:heat shock protein HslJ
MNFRHFSAIVLCLIGLVGCSQPRGKFSNSSAVRLEKTDLAGSWSLQQVGRSKAANPNSLLLELNPSGASSGSLACNKFSGTWNFENGHLSMQSDEITVLGCTLGPLEARRNTLMAFIGSGGSARLDRSVLIVVVNQEKLAFRRIK